MTTDASDVSAVPSRTVHTSACWLAAIALDRSTAPRPATVQFFGDGRPNTAETVTCTVVFDGILFERDKLARRLIGGLSEPRNDAALILDAYREWGEAFPEKIGGTFSLAVWDAAQNLFLIVRDPVGTTPLYYTPTATEFVASSSIDALLAYPGVCRDVNRHVLAEHLCHRWLHREETYFANIHRLPPGHAMRLKRGTRTISKYRDRFPSEQRIDWATENDLEQFDSLLVRAVRRRLLGPVGINLSGGLDSVTVAALAVEESRRMGLPVPCAFSLAFPEPMNEEQTQRRVAADLGLQLTLMSLGEAAGSLSLLQSALEASASRPTPLINLWAPAYRTLGRAAREQGCAVVLTGNGGDDWLTVSPWVAADLIRTADLAGLYQFWRMWQRSYRYSHVGAARLMWEYGGSPVLRAKAAGMLQHIAPSVLRRHRRRKNDEVLPSYVAPDPAFREELCDRLEAQQGPPDPEGFYARDLRRAVTSAVTLTEREESWNSGQEFGVPLAHPFWDLDLTELLCRTPPKLLSKGGRSKGLVRRTLAHRFPALGFESHRKLGATPFFKQVLTEEGPAVWRALGGTPKLASLGIVDPTRTNEVMMRHLQSLPSREAFRMWYLLSVEGWLQGQPNRLAGVRRPTVDWVRR